MSLNISSVYKNYYNCTDTFEIMLSPTNMWSMRVTDVLHLISFVLNSLLIVTQFLMQTYESNIRLLISNVSVACIVTSFVQWYREIICNITPPENYCHQFVSTRVECRRDTLLEYAAISCLVFSIPFIVIERAAATMFHKTYEADKRWTLLGTGLCMISWSNSLLYYALFYFHKDPSDDTSLPLCVYVLTAGKSSAIAYICYVLFSKAVSLLFYLKLLAINRQKLIDFAINQAQFSLASRFQLKQSVELAEVLIPTIVSHSLVWLFMEILLLFIVMIDNVVPDQIKWLTLLNNVVAIQGIIFPAVIFQKHEPVRKKLKQCVDRMLMGLLHLRSARSEVSLHSVFRDPSVATNHDPKEYFRSLEASWEQRSAAKKF